MHDLEDGLAAGMFSEAQLEGEVALWRRARAAVERRHPSFLASTDDSKLRVKRVSNELIKLCINDLLYGSSERILAAGLTSPHDARARPAFLIGNGEVLAREIAELSRFLYARFYRHPHLQDLTRDASATLAGLFAAYLERPGEMTPWYQRWIAEVGLHRAVCDYLAGMTDRFAEREFARLVRRS
jgi:dGTPase